MANEKKTVSGQFYNWSDAAQGAGVASFGRYTAVLNYQLETLLELDRGTWKNA
jgi:hypothetical protein